MNSNLSAILEDEIARRITMRQRERWLQENTKAIQTYNDFVEKEGFFGDGIRGC